MLDALGRYGGNARMADDELSEEGKREAEGPDLLDGLPLGPVVARPTLYALMAFPGGTAARKYGRELILSAEALMPVQSVHKPRQASKKP
jgi:hypothetical protein